MIGTGWEEKRTDIDHKKVVNAKIKKFERIAKRRGKDHPPAAGLFLHTHGFIYDRRHSMFLAKKCCCVLFYLLQPGFNQCAPVAACRDQACIVKVVTGVMHHAGTFPDIAITE
ncbi:hypothetical protein HmCmsJML288_02681 [Escherichia coli]|nr:hypothetical protein HmCmsJML288_02681 [Escherichia coli]